MGFATLLLAGVVAYGAPVPDDWLAAERGGFSLPNGVEVALSVDTQTAVNGALVLRSIFRVDQGAPQTAVYVPRSGTTVQAGAPADRPGGGGGVQVMYDPRTGVQVSPTAPRVSVGTGSVPLQPGLVRAGDGTVTDRGVVALGAAGTIQTAGLRGAGIDITHLAGSAIGSAIANSTSGQTIDTRTDVTIDLRNAGPDVIGSAMLQVQGLATEAVMGRVR